MSYGQALGMVAVLSVVGTAANAAGEPTASIQLTSPIGGEVWTAHSKHYITWTSDHLPPSMPVSVAYTTDGGENWIEIADAAGNSGKLLWEVPVQVSDHCRVRISASQLRRTAQSASDFSVVPSQQVSDYHWVRATLEAPFAPRDGAGGLTFKGRMWLLGGWNPGDKVHFPRICNNEVWSSRDGVAWTLVKPNTFLDATFDPAGDWEGRHTAGYVVYHDRMWIVGGDVNQGHYHNDVWNSADGKTWTWVNRGRDVPWGPRALHYTLVFQDKIWVMGGQTMPRFAPSQEIFYRDIWNTQDGIHWEQVKPKEPLWSARGMIGGNVILGDRMWILGGGTYDTPTTPTRRFYNDVWSSADGMNWERRVQFAPWEPRQYHEVAVFDDRMWILEGWNQRNRNDVWYSADGINWYELPNTPWKPRHAASVFVHDNSMWIVAGNNMEADVWRLQRASKLDNVRN